MKNDIHRVLLRTLPTLYEGQTLETLPRHILNFLSRVIPADLTAYNEVDLKRSCAKIAMSPAGFRAPSEVAAFQKLMHQHPLIRHQRQTGDLSARKISDFLSRAQFHRTPLYNEVYRHLNGEDQMALTVRFASNTIVALAMNRGRRSFTERDRHLLNLLQPHLVRSYRNAETLTLVQSQLAAMRSVVERLSLGLVILDRRMRIEFATGRARGLLKKYFPTSGDHVRLPAALGAWLQRSCRWQDRPLPNAASSFDVSRPAGTLEVRRVSQQGAGQTVLVLDERSVPLSAKPLEALKLTPREAEVLLWVSQGKSNPEIGIILGAASRTVQKHLERIFEKLQVESRTAAARRALEMMDSGLSPEI